MTEILEPMEGGQDYKRAVIKIVHMFKKEDEHLSMIQKGKM